MITKTKPAVIEVDGEKYYADKDMEAVFNEAVDRTLDKMSLAVFSAQLSGLMSTMVTFHKMGIVDLDGKALSELMWDVRALTKKVKEKQDEIGTFKTKGKGASE